MWIALGFALIPPLLLFPVALRPSGIIGTNIGDARSTAQAVQEDLVRLALVAIWHGVKPTRPFHVWQLTSVRYRLPRTSSPCQPTTAVTPRWRGGCARKKSRFERVHRGYVTMLPCCHVALPCSCYHVVMLACLSCAKQFVDNAGWGRINDRELEVGAQSNKLREKMLSVKEMLAVANPSNA